MLQDLIVYQMNAKNKIEKEKAYKMLEQVGVDRMTADYIVSKCKEEK